MNEKWRSAYDAWKTRSPDEDRTRRWFLGECDCCGKMRPLTRTYYAGIETFACDECREAA